MTEQEKILHYKTSIILGKDTSEMKLNNIIEELVQVIEQHETILLRNEPLLTLL
jgi:hypothetical protein